MGVFRPLGGGESVDDDGDVRALDDASSGRGLNDDMRIAKRCMYELPALSMFRFDCFLALCFICKNLLRHTAACRQTKDILISDGSTLCQLFRVVLHSHRFYNVSH